MSHLKDYTVYYILDVHSRLIESAVICIFQMWMSARSLLSPHVSISVSIHWAPIAVSATQDTSCRDIGALVSHLII